MARQARIALLAALAFAMITGMLFLDRIPQDPSYHSFADQRHIGGIPNCINVVSNVFFLLVGMYGIIFLRKARMQRSVALMYGMLFTGIVLTGIGSAYYHLSPNDHRLVWDRLPMTIIFMSFLAATIAERISMHAAQALLFPLVLAGIASICWWHYTEQQGNGDLRFYALVQFLPVLFIPLILLLFPSRTADPGTLPLFLAVAMYVIAKLFEHLDKELWSLTGFISGHSLKHIAASAATWCIVRMAIKRHSANTFPNNGVTSSQ